jgi:hypothetical protein
MNDLRAGSGEERAAAQAVEKLGKRRRHLRLRIDQAANERRTADMGTISRMSRCCSSYMARPRTSDHRPSIIAVPDVRLGAATGHAGKLDDTTQRTGTTSTTHRGARPHPFGGSRLMQYMRSRKNVRSVCQML